MTRILLVAALLAAVACAPLQPPTIDVPTASIPDGLTSDPLAPDVAKTRIKAAIEPGGRLPALALESSPGGAASSWLFDFREWIAARESRGLADFTADVPGPDNPANRGGKLYHAPPGEAWGWKGVYNTNGYGLAELIRQALRRYDPASPTLYPGHALPPDVARACWQWIRANCLRNVYNYWIYFQTKGRGPNEAVGYRWETNLPAFVTSAAAMSGIPVSELCYRDAGGRWLVPAADTWDGSSYGRHHTYDFIATCAADAMVPLTDRERELCLAMLTHYGHERIQSSRVPPPATTRHEWGHYYIRTYVATYRVFRSLYRDQAEAALARFDNPAEGDQVEPLTDAEKVAVDRWQVGQTLLRLAEGVVFWGWHPSGPGKPSPVRGRDGAWYWAWDQSTPDNPEWHHLNQIRTARPWYVGLRASAWFYLWAEPDSAGWIRKTIEWVTLEEARWCSRDWAALPGAPETASDTTLRLANGWIHGGFMPGATAGGRWIRQTTKPLTPKQWAALPENVKYHPLTAIKVRESDADYFGRWWGSTQMERWHYPKIRISNNEWPKEFGPRIDINGGASWTGLADLVALAGALRQNDNQVRYGIWLAHDYLASSNVNHSGFDLQRAKNQANPRWYGFNKNRAFYWTMACGEVLKLLAFGQL